MIMISSALMLVLAAAAADPVKQSGQAYTACLKALTVENLEKKVDPDTFDGALAGACTTQEAAFRSAIVAQQMASKATRPDAEQAATDWITDYQANAKEMYRDYHANNSKPAL